jgi:alpha-1,3(6)-mannosylglycoprotein beta-1,6-N-acetyl-glucosaminyltransferase
LQANTKALLGIGRPPISPTPYASLCRGVPVVLPYRSDKGCPARPAPTDYCGFYWDTHQHGPAAALGEPYIYTVDVTGPEEEIIRTIERAVRTPIEPLCVFQMPSVQIYRERLCFLCSTRETS